MCYYHNGMPDQHIPVNLYTLTHRIEATLARRINHVSNGWSHIALPKAHY